MDCLRIRLAHGPEGSRACRSDPYVEGSLNIPYTDIIQGVLDTCRPAYGVVRAFSSISLIRAETAGIAPVLDADDFETGGREHTGSRRRRGRERPAGTWFRSVEDHAQRDGETASPAIGDEAGRRAPNQFVALGGHGCHQLRELGGEC